MSEINIIVSPPITALVTSESTPVDATADAAAPIEVVSSGTPPPGLPPGGTTGQIPSKASNANWDVVWIDNTGGGGGISDAPNNANYYLRHALAWSVAATVAQTGVYADLTGKPTLGTAAAHADTDFAAASHTHPTSDIVSGTFADARISQSSVTQHQAALAIAATQVTSGVLADGRVQQSNVTQHQAALALAATQITSGVLANGRVQQSNVTQHEAALSINYTQLTGTPPPLLISTPNVVASQAAQLALTAQQGDIAIRTDTNLNYIHNGGVAGTMADWTQMLTPTDLVVSVFGRTGSVTAQSGDYTFSQIGSTPTTAAGYGIPAATGSIDGYATSTQITKLNGIATAATANSSDATLLARANHTGTQLAATISDFNTAADARAAAALLARTINTTAPITGGGNLSADRTIAMAAATASADGYATTTQITKLNGIATGATANSSDATLLARTNHTGTQLASTISDFNTAADARAVLKTECIIIAASDETTNLTTGTAKVTFRMPYAFTLTAIRASLTAAQTAGSDLIVDVNEGGTTLMSSSKLRFDNNEKTTTTSSNAPALTDTALADDAEVTVDIDQVGTAGAKGLKVYLIGHQ